MKGTTKNLILTYILYDKKEKNCELEEHWAERQAQNHMANQMHYLLFSRASVIQFCTLTYL